MKYRIGIDLGGTKTEAILIAPDDSVITRRRVETPRSEGYKAIVKNICTMIKETSSLVPCNLEYSIGIGIPGSVNPLTDLVQNANTTCLIDTPLQKEIERRIGRKVGMENDANCFTLAESKLGAGRGYALVCGIIMGTGCGGGICFDGQIWKGQNAIAGEWGHISIDPEGESCYCGNRGCVETKISGQGVENLFFKKFNQRLTMQQIIDGYSNGNPECVEIFSGFMEDFGRSLGGLISILDPDVVVLGGGLSNIEALYTTGVEKVKNHVFHKNIKTPVLKNSLGDSAGVFGAAWIGI